MKTPFGSMAAACLVATSLPQPAAAQDRHPASPPPDAAFEASLPSLDQPAASKQAPAPAAHAPTPDAAFQAPLTPLEAFDAAPLRSIDATDEGDRAAQVRYEIALTGLADPDLTARFRELSALHRGVGAPAAAGQVRLRADADAALLVQLLKADGYYDAAATVDLDPPTGRTDRLAVRLTVAAGPRYELGAIRVTGAPAAPTRIARAALDVRTGDPIVATAIEAAEAKVALRLPQAGYPFAEVGPRDIVLDAATRRGDYSLPLSAGPLGRFGGFQIAGKPVFDAEHVRVLARFRPGQTYDSRKVEDLRQALVATSLLSMVALEPVRTGTSGPDGSERVDLRVRQVPAPPRSLAAAAGYGTGEGFRLSGSWSHRNLFPPEGALSLDAVAATQEQRLGATLRRSNAGQRDRTLQASAELSRETRQAYDARSAKLSARVSRDSTPLWQKRWTYAYGGELIATDETQFDAASAAKPRKNTFLIAALPAQLGYDTSDSLLDPTRGFRVTGRLSPEVAWRDAMTPYARTLLETTGYAPFGDRLVLAGRLRLGAVTGIARDDLAPSRRLYAGGGGSVRGFGYQDLGPRDANGDPLGGRGLTEMSLEARFRWGDIGVVPFVDAGQVYSASRPGLDDLRVGAGLGGRYYTPFGPLRIDVATPLSRRPGDPRVALYISIGQAF